MRASAAEDVTATVEFRNKIAQEGKIPKGTERMRIWAITDGAAGAATQAAALGAAVAERTGAELVEKRIALRPFAALIPPRLAGFRTPRDGGWPFTDLTDGGAALARPWPDLAIGAGRRSAPAVAALGALGGAATAQILDPGFSLKAFDLVIAPRHDRLRGENVLETLGALSRVTPEALNAARGGHPGLAAALAAAGAPTARIAVLVGGPGRGAGCEQGDFETLAAGLARLRAAGAFLMITPSRRTPRVAFDLLARAAGEGAFVWDGEGDNPYLPMLAAADAVVATADSVNMATDAAAAGLPICISPVSRMSAKIARFHETLAERCGARPFDGRPPEGAARPPLDDLDRAADRLAAVLTRRAGA